MKEVFEHLGYSIEYYVAGKYMGSIKTDTKPISFGYNSRQYFIADNTFTLTNGMGNSKSIKKGSRYYTEAIKLCGKMLGDHNSKMDLFRNSKAWRDAR